MRALAGLVLLVGVGIAAVLIATKPQPEAVAEENLGRLVRTFVAQPTSHRIAVRAYGTSRAADEWVATAEVAGRITKLDERFEDGEIIPADTLLATVDKLDFELAVKSAQTEVASREQQLVELAQSKANVENLLGLREEQLKFAKSDLDRVTDLLARGAGTKAEYERVSSTYIDRQAALRDLQNQLALFPIQEQSLKLGVESARLRLQQVQRDVERCEIRLPFTALCITRDIELHQQAAVGQQLGRFLALERAEIVAMVEPRRALGLFSNLGEAWGAIDLRKQTSSLINELRDRLETLKIPADVTWRAGEGEVQWRGRLARASATVDESTRSLPMIVEVKDAFSQVQIGVKPALVPGMFVEVIFYGEMLEDVYVIPREAIRDESVYVVRDGRLAIVPIHVLALEDETAVVDSGLSPGDQVVLADLFPAANGMPLRTEQIPNPASPRLKLPELSKAGNQEATP